jgi:hypothetical protein
VRASATAAGIAGGKPEEFGFAGRLARDRVGVAGDIGNAKAARDDHAGSVVASRIASSVGATGKLTLAASAISDRSLSENHLTAAAADVGQTG